MKIVPAQKYRKTSTRNKGTYSWVEGLFIISKSCCIPSLVDSMSVLRCAAISSSGVVVLENTDSQLSRVVTSGQSPILTNCGFGYSEKRNNTISQMRLRSVFKMRMSILNTATTEQMGYGIISFFVYTKSTN